MNPIILVSILSCLILRILSKCFTFDFNNQSNCYLCSIDQYDQNQAEFWIMPQNSFPDSKCLQKNESLFSKTIFVSSEIICDGSFICDGSINSPFDNLFDAFWNIMNLTKTYFQSNITLYLVGTKPHFFYSSIIGIKEVMFFRRTYANISIQPLFCDIIYTNGCLNSTYDKSWIQFKSDNILIFISSFFTLQNIIIQGVDIVYNYYQSTQSKTNITVCSEINLFGNTSNDNCSLSNLVVKFDSNKPYGLFNLEFLQDCLSICSIPTLRIINCEFSNFISFSDGNSLISIINVLKPLFANIIINNTLVSKIFLLKGLINLNINFDYFYKGSNLKFVTPKEYGLSINFCSNIVEKYNFFNLTVDKANSYAFTFYNLIYLNFDDFNYYFTISLLQNIYSNNNLSIFGENFIWISILNVGPKNISIFSIDTNYFINNSVNNLLVLKQSPSFTKIEISNCYFSSNTHIKIQTFDNTLFFTNNTIDSNSYPQYFFNLFKTTIIIWKSLFTNIFQKQFSALINVDSAVGGSSLFTSSQTRNLTFEKIYIRETYFKNIQNFGIIMSKNPIRELFVENSKLQHIDVSIQNFIFSSMVENIISITNVSFEDIISNYIFNHDRCRNRTFEKITLSNSITGFIKCFALSILDFHRIAVIFKEIKFENITLSANIFSVVDMRINYVYDVLDCFFYNFSAKNISLQKMSNNLPKVIYLEHCSYSWFSYFYLEDLNDILFLHLFNHNKVNSDGSRLRPFLNLTNFVLRNDYLSILSLISLDTIFYSIISNSSFSSKLVDYSYISSNCYPNCYIIFENVVFYYNSPFQLQYQNIQSVFIKNCTFMKTTFSYLFFHDSGINLSSPFSNFTPPISIINTTAIKNFRFEYDDISNFFDLDLTWNKYINIFGFLDCLFLESQGTSLIIAENNDLIIDRSFFLGSIVNEFGVIYISKLSSLYISNSIFYNCNSSSNAGAVFFSSSSKGFVYNSSFLHLTSESYGGAFFLPGPQTSITFSKTNFENCMSLQGGVIFAKESIIRIIDSISKDSSVRRQGGFLYAETSTIEISNLQVLNSSSQFYGGVFSIYFSAFKIYDSSFISSHAKNGIFYIAGKNDSISNCKNLSFKGNYIDKTPDLISMYPMLNYREGLHFLELLYFENNTSPSSFLSIYSSFLIVVIHLKNIIFFNNSIGSSLFTSMFTEISIFNMSLQNNTIISSIIDFKNSNLSIIESHINYQDSITLNLANFIFSGYFSCFVSKNLSLLLSKNFGGFSCNSCENVSIEDSYFSRCSQKLNGGAILIKSSNFLNLKNVTFLENEALNGGAIYIENTNFQFDVLIFRDNFAHNVGSDIYCQNKYLNDVSTINNSYFSNFSMNSLNFYFLNNLLLYVNYFKGNDELGFYREIEIYEVNNLSIINSFFEISSIKTLQSSDQMYLLTINNSTFLDCSTSNGGGAIYLDGYFDINIYLVSFLKNTAEKDGGAIYFKCKLSKNLCFLHLKNSYFVGNEAKFLGGAIKVSFILPSLAILNENVFLNNNALYGENLSTGPSFLTISSDSRPLISISSEILEIKSVFTNQIYVFVWDQLNNLLFSDSQGKFFIETKAENVSLQNKEVNEFNGKGYFDSFIAIGTPGDKFSATIIYQNDICYLDYSIQFYFSSCAIGDFYYNFQCLTCASSLFSLDSDPVKNNKTSCELCPQNAICPGRNLIIPMAGYWRYDENTKYIAECTSFSNCIDQSPFYLVPANNNNSILTYNLSKPFKFICGEGSFGNLCSNCLFGYGKDGRRTCVKCEFYKSFLIAIFSLLFLLYQTEVATKINESSSQTRGLLKLLINHNYYLSFIVFLPNEFSGLFSYIFGFINDYLTIIPENLNNLECVISYILNTDDYFGSKLIVYSFFPFIISFILITIKSCITFFRMMLFQKSLSSSTMRTNFKKELFLSIISSFIVTIYSFYTRILTTNLNLLRCIQIDDNADALYLMPNPNIMCWVSGGQHYKILASLFFPNFLIWCVGFPVVMVLLLRGDQQQIKKNMKSAFYLNKKFSMKKRKQEIEFKEKKKTISIQLQKIEKEIVINKKIEKDFTKSEIDEGLSQSSSNIIHQKTIYKFLTMDYRKEFYFWECFFYCTMLIISVINALSAKLTLIPQMTLLILVYMLMLIITEVSQPFKHKIINNTACYSYVALICTLSFYIILNTQGSKNHSDNIYLFIYTIILINSIFYGRVFFHYFLLFIQTDFKILKKRASQMMSSLRIRSNLHKAK